MSQVVAASSKSVQDQIDSLSSSGRALIIASRVIGGFASGGGFVVALRSLVSSVTPDKKLAVMNQTRIAAICARILGPVIGSIFLFVPSQVSGSLVLNYATFPALIAACLELLTFLGIAVAYQRDQEGQVEEHWNWRFWQDQELRGVLKELLSILAIITCSMTAMWLLYSQLIAICGFVYEVVDGLNNLWVVYLPLIVGSFGYSLVVDRLFNWLSFGQLAQVYALALLLLIGAVLLFPFSAKPEAALFYAGGVIFFLANSGIQTILRAVYARFACQTLYLGMLLSLLSIANGVAQFIGSSIAGAIVTPTVDTDWLLPHNCSTAHLTAFNYTCHACDISPLQIIVAVNNSSPLKLACWNLDNYLVLIAVLTAVVLVSAGFVIFFLRKHSVLKNVDLPEDANESSRLLRSSPYSTN